jgi:hypothetical protein
VIIVVLALMTTLVVLGLFFYYFTVDEAVNAQNMALAEDYEISAEAIFAEAEHQFIVSTDDSREYSALAGSNWSLLAHIIGPLNGNGSPRSLQPYSGAGIQVEVSGGGFPATDNAWRIRIAEVDYNNNGVVDPDEDLNGNGELDRFEDYNNNGVLDPGEDLNGNGVLDYGAVFNGNDSRLRLNLGRAADGQPVPSLRYPVNTGYTYPDVNAPWLAVDFLLEDVNTPANSLRVVRPSFLPIQLFPDFRNSGNFAATRPTQSFRPHQQHRLAGGNTRFVVSTTTAQSGDRSRVLEPFPRLNDTKVAGVWTGHGNDYSGYDVDLDGDGIPDSILLDLDHPPIRLPDGREIVPIFSVKIVDLDGRFNLNVHGNRSFEEFGINNITSSQPVSASNHGLSVTEINPVWGLRGSPHSGYYYSYAGNNPAITQAMAAHYAVFNSYFPSGIADYYASAPTHRERYIATANMELEFLLRGRPALPGQPAVLGRWGQTAQPLTAGDDDNDANLGGRAHTDQFLAGVAHPPQVHPLDYRGISAYPNAGNRNGRLRSVAAVDGNRPGRWPNYDELMQEQALPADPLVNEVVTTRDLPALQPGAIQGLTNEPDEFIAEANFKNRLIAGQPRYNSDALFGPEEVAAMQLSEHDWRRLRGNSRARQLASFNFEDSRRADEIRKLFTSHSFDRNEFSLAMSPQRMWEFNDYLYGANGRFPPAFGVGGAITSRHERVIPSSPPFAFINQNDPFRPVLRRLLTIEPGARDRKLGNGRRFPQQPLDINRLLVQFDPHGNPLYRELMPHPVFEATDMDTNNYLGGGASVRPMQHTHLPTGDSFVDLNAAAFSADQLDPPLPAVAGFNAVPLTACNTDKFAQEVWARYDRQRLARDIYVMLYTLGGPSNRNYAEEGWYDPSGTPAERTAAKERLREMAQFAVNYVDALDPDDVITRFEFDYNLTNGWGNWADQSGTALEDREYDVVYGVETASLTLSEALVIRAKNQSSDLARTLHNDADGVNEHRWLYLELRNASPFDVPLKNQSWRIVRTDPNDHTVRSAVSFVENGGTFRVVEGGGNFLLSCHDGEVRNAGGQNISSDFYADFANGVGGNDDNLEAFAPHHRNTHHVANNNANPDPLADLDLAAPHPNHSNFRQWLDSNSYLVESVPSGAGTGAPLEFDLVLQRRRNLHGQGFGEGDNDWIEVDRINVRQDQIFDPEAHNMGNGNTQTAIRDELLGRGGMNARVGFSSQERAEPFTRGPLDLPTSSTGAKTYPTHTLEGSRPPSTLAERHRANSNLGGANFNVWQPHFNRRFTSIVELLSVPLYGYRNIQDTTSFDRDLHGGPTQNLAEAAAGALRLSGHKAAERRFLFPQNDPAVPNTLENNWFRLLGLLQVPLEDQRTIQNELTVQRRTPGKINLNTIPHEAVFAGLMDSRQFNRLNPANPINFAAGVDPTANSTGLTFDQVLGYQRYLDFINARDGGIDGISGLVLPGLPGSTPFKPLTGGVAATVEQSILRSSPVGMNQTWPKEFRLWTAAGFDAMASPAEFEAGTDYHTRNRILAKIANLSTTRSHVFGMWIGFQMHECHTVQAGAGTATQIGNRAADFPLRRKFLVVDMSRLEEAYDPITNTFDYKKFIIFEQLLP